jgi:hypothetical protein
MGCAFYAKDIQLDMAFFSSYAKRARKLAG